MKKEKDFQMEFKRSFDKYLVETYQDGMYRKIPDLGFQNPFDCWTLHSGNYIAWELKRNLAKNTFNFKTFFSDREHELFYLNKTIKAGGKSGVLINHYEKGKRNDAYLVKTRDARRWYESGKSVKLDELLKYGIQVPRVTGGWDLKVAINFLLKERAATCEKCGSDETGLTLSDNHLELCDDCTADEEEKKEMNMIMDR